MYPAWEDDLLDVLEEADEIILSQHARFRNEPVNNLQAHDRKGINRFVHRMYGAGEELYAADDDDDIPPESSPDSDDDSENDYQVGYLVAGSDGYDDEL
ncbi:hypothetical protein yc1106_02281 [Curvularia clavata]|uniref:Uncharacterized protein n=1 Tax=Curvularia clavata TaxID=95742 RepID=A0A9Q9DPX2_CURCL|nr:hypothetical protein yc1106_02281 [Curvularia clavata]